jgi:hypothetical protein
MRRGGATALALLLACGSALAQSTPFDMSTERKEETVPPAAVQPTPPVPVTPAPAPPQVEAPMAINPAVKQPKPPEANVAVPERPTASAPAEAYRRPLVPTPSLTLDGENPRRSWALYLTAEQAASASTLHYAYRNSVVVAPESSRLRIQLNGVSLADEPVQSPDGFGARAAVVPAGILREGRNEISFSADQRHRTDCTVESTYELWTEIDAAQTALGFTDADAAQFSTPEDLRALSADADGKAVVNIVAPALAASDIASDLVGLAQAIALYAALPGLQFNVAPTRPQEDGALTVLVGTSGEIAALGADGIARDGHVAQFATVEPGKPPVFVVAGNSREEWRAAIDGLRRAVDRPASSQREVLKTESWRGPDAPMLYGARRLAFSELGLRSQEFTGRRFHTEFHFAVPADFYAEAYGEARILLDAGYSSEVLPGSLINVYVNGNIAASVPITNSGGAVMSKQPIKVTMRHFRPGLNLIAIDAELRTAADATCAPGSIAGDKPRFALFDTSQFVMPQFGRIAQRPNLAAVSGTGFPYGREAEPVVVVAGRGDRDAISAAASVFARMAVSAGRVIDTEFVASADAARGRNALIVGPINQIADAALQQLGIDAASRTAWSSGAAASDLTVSPDQWRLDIQGSWMRRALRRVQNWMSETFNITDEMLRFAPGTDEVFAPPTSATLLIAQQANPDNTGVWTLVTAPSVEMLRSSVAAMVAQVNWSGLEGHLTTFDVRTGQMQSRPVNSFGFVETQPRSFANARLVVANWLSANILSYALILIVVCLVLGASTSMLLTRLGRRT